jgi:hypothetical protein
MLQKEFVEVAAKAYRSAIKSGLKVGLLSDLRLAESCPKQWLNEYINYKRKRDYDDDWDFDEIVTLILKTLGNEKEKNYESNQKI